MFIISEQAPNVNTFFDIFLFLFFLGRVRQQLLQLIARKTIDFVAELAGYFTFLLFCDHLGKLGLSEADQRALDLFPAACASVADLLGLEEVHFEAVEHGGDDLLEAHALVEHGRHRLELCEIGFEAVDVCVLDARHQLHEPAAGTLDRAVGVDEHAERTGRRDLLALRKVAREILCDLAVHERDRAGHGVLEADVLDDHQIAAAYAAAHVELAVRAERQVSGRVLKIAAHAAVRLAHAHDGAERAVALDLNGDRAVLDLELTAHDGGDGQRAAERCGRKRRGVMNFACALDNSGRRCGTDLDARVAGDRAKNFIAHIMLVSLSCGEIDAILSALYGREALIAIGFDFGKAGLFQHADKLLRLVDALLVRFLRARPAVPILFKNIELISAQAVLDCRLPDAEHAVVLADIAFPVDTGEFRGRIDVKDEQAVRIEEQVHAAERLGEVVRVGDIVHAVQTAQAGVHIAVKVKLLHALIDEQRSRRAVHRILHGLHEHFGRRVRADHVVAAFREQARQAARAAGQIEHQLRPDALPCKKLLEKIRPLPVADVVGKTIIVGRKCLIAIHCPPSAGRAFCGSRPSRKQGIC